MAIFKTRKEREALKAAKILEALKAKTRKPDDVGMEYSRLCSTAGDKQYRIKTMQMELDCINERLAQLNDEFEKAQKVHGSGEPVKSPVVEQVPEALTSGIDASIEVEKSETTPKDNTDQAVTSEVSH